MRRTLAIFALGVTLLSGCATPPATSEPLEDEPGFNCWTHGNKICGGNPIERTEAWGKFSHSALPAETRGKEHRVTYLGLALEGVDFPPSEFYTTPSAITPGKSHVFRVEVAP